MRSIILVPTYNERENIGDLISAIRGETAGLPSLDVLVIDSGSPDKTAELVLELARNDEFLYLLEQPKKLGLGRAYLDGMNWALGRDYDVIITMDADFSHHPRYLKRMLSEIQSADLVVGSRYVEGGELQNWPWTRKLLSRFANWYASRLTGLPVNDLTSGFHCFRRELLRKVLRYPLRADGYAFLISLKFWAVVQEARITEIPIVFSDRTRGDSKISKHVILESIFFVWKCFFQRHRLGASLKTESKAAAEDSAAPSKLS